MKKNFLMLLIFVIGLSIMKVSAQTVTKIYLTLDPGSNTGSCPRVLKFHATLLTDRHPGNVTLKWLDPKGSVVHTSTVTLTTSGQDTTDFRLAIPTKISSGISIVTTATKPVQSNEIQYTVTCK